MRVAPSRQATRRRGTTPMRAPDREEPQQQVVVLRPTAIAIAERRHHVAAQHPGRMGQGTLDEALAPNGVGRSRCCAASARSRAAPVAATRAGRSARDSRRPRACGAAASAAACSARRSRCIRSSASMRATSGAATRREPRVQRGDEVPARRVATTRKRASSRATASAIARVASREPSSTSTHSKRASRWRRMLARQAGQRRRGVARGQQDRDERVRSLRFGIERTRQHARADHAVVERGGAIEARDPLGLHDARLRLEIDDAVRAERGRPLRPPGRDAASEWLEQQQADAALRARRRCRAPSSSRASASSSLTDQPSTQRSPAAARGVASGSSARLCARQQSEGRVGLARLGEHEAGAVDRDDVAAIEHAGRCGARGARAAAEIEDAAHGAEARRIDAARARAARRGSAAARSRWRARRACRGPRRRAPRDRRRRGARRRATRAPVRPCAAP